MATSTTLQPVQTGLVTQAAPTPTPTPTPTPAPISAPPISEVRDDQESSATPQAPTEPGQGTDYTGKSEEDILAGSQKGLVSLLKEDNPYMQMARAQGARQAEARGLGGSTLRERASEGAAIASAMPLVQQASQQASSERQAAQQFTAQSEISAENRRLSEMQQQQDIAARAVLAENENTLQREMQSIDVEYKQWLEGVTFKHQGILQGNAQAANSYSDFTNAAMNILNNPDTSTPQKQASIDALKEALANSLTVISATADIDLGQFLPTSTTSPTRPTSPIITTDTVQTDIPETGPIDWGALVNMPNRARGHWNIPSGGIVFSESGWGQDASLAIQQGSPAEAIYRAAMKQGYLSVEQQSELETIGFAMTP